MLKEQVLDHPSRILTQFPGFFLQPPPKDCPLLSLFMDLAGFRYPDLRSFSYLAPTAFPQAVKPMVIS